MSTSAVREMDFLAFVDWSRRIRADRPDVAPRCETRIARAFAAMKPAADVPADAEKVHRCDLAKEWCGVRALPATLSSRALVCRGVRHALQIMFTQLAKHGTVVLLPSDVYPVYWTLARDAGTRVVGAKTFPNWDLDGILAEAARQDATYVLLPYPLKLHGRAWSPSDQARAKEWLAADGRRRLMLDGVYSFGCPLGADVEGLIATDQVVYLDSLSKGWLHEQVFGTAIVPERDFVRWAPVFRTESPSTADLRAARALLSGASDLPTRLTSEIDRLRDALATKLAQKGVSLMAAASGYLLGVEGEADALVESHGILTIPASVFGSDVPGWSIASALPAVPIQ